MIVGIGNATGTEPYQSTLAGIDLDRQGDEAEQRSSGKRMMPISSNSGKELIIRIPANITHVMMLEANETTGTNLLRMVSGA